MSIRLRPSGLLSSQRVESAYIPRRSRPRCCLGAVLLISTFCVSCANLRGLEAIPHITATPSTFAHVRDSADATPAPTTGEVIRLVQYNVQFLLPRWLQTSASWFQNLGINFNAVTRHFVSSRQRARAIGSLPALACADIIALNETVVDERRVDLLQALEAAAPTCPRQRSARFATGQFFTSVHGPSLPQGNLLTFLPRLMGGQPIIGNAMMLMSRFPIVATHSLIYRNAAGLDRLIAKGALHARLWRGGQSPATATLDVFVTHLDAGDEATALAQIEELTAFIHKHHDPIAPLFILGDLNIDGSSHVLTDQHSAYRQLAKRLTALGVTDLGRHAGPTNFARTKRIDYIFAATAMLRPLTTRAEYFDGRLPNSSRSGQLSDHAAVIAEMVWPIDTSSPLSATP